MWLRIDWPLGFFHGRQLQLIGSVDISCSHGDGHITGQLNEYVCTYPVYMLGLLKEIKLNVAMLYGDFNGPTEFPSPELKTRNDSETELLVPDILHLTNLLVGWKSKKSRLNTIFVAREKANYIKGLFSL